MKPIQDNGMTLVHEATGAPVMVGEKLTDFRGDPGTITSGTAPRSPASSGRVMVDGMSLYPSVFNCKWVLNSEVKTAPLAQVIPLNSARRSRT